MGFTDQINHTIHLESFPKRIISLVPSQTELLYDLGLESEVVGITKFCIHPKIWFEVKNRVGGTKTVNFDKIAALKPDLIIANKEENTQSEIEKLQKLYPVYTSDISNLDESLKMIEQIGVITSKQKESKEIIKKVKTNFNTMKPYSMEKNRVIYLIWKDPFMTIGQNTFISDMMRFSGFQNIIKENTDYPELSKDEIERLDPDFIFLSSEPYPFKEKHIRELKKISPNSKIILVDGEYFSWYGSRLQNAVSYFMDLINKIG